MPDLTSSPDFGAQPGTGTVVETLTAFLSAPAHERRALAPGLVDGVGERALDAVLTATWRRIGPFVAVVEGHEGLEIRGTRGQASAWAVRSVDGRLSGLVIGGRRRAPRLHQGRFAALFWCGWLILWALSCVACWQAGSVAEWIFAAGFLSILVVLFQGFDVPAKWKLPRAVQRVVVVAAAASLLSVVRLPGLPAGNLDSWTVGTLSVLGFLVVTLLRGRGYQLASQISRPLAMPFGQGTWYVVQGGGPGLNHHVRVAAQRGALDLVALGATGGRASGLSPREVTDFAAYGVPVLAPCDGTVVRALDGLQDQVPGRPWAAPPYGNHVSIDTGHEVVHLAHLRPGSVRVRTGEQVRTGQVLGEVGNSGRSTEPHLHLHAEREGQGLELRFIGIDGGLRRGRRITV
ncbi:hypothetical protein ABIA33_004212 [Streptacidiphilus sp. MAP12-16]|uniref:M23 family metallopeptidase n=1 Tax=Streptacidiphilus sp. MAP12-16 TaxID=3156300 RepID=UPI0035163D3A